MVVMRIVLLCMLALWLDAAFSNPQCQTTWTHNGSTVKLLSSGRSRTFVYETPREGMRGAGARSGSVLFEGERNGNRYSGTAYIFSKRCGRLPYPVSGDVSEDQREVVLRGTAPRADANCNAVPARSDVLTFTLLEPEAPVVAQDNEGAAPATPTPTPTPTDTKPSQVTPTEVTTTGNVAEPTSAPPRSTQPAAKDVTGSIGVVDSARANSVRTFGAAAPALVVVIVSLLIEIFKLFPLSIRNELLAGTIANLATGLTLTTVGYSADLKVLGIPLLGGFVALAAVVSLKRLARRKPAMQASSP
jgi:hypothetical protein